MAERSEFATLLDQHLAKGTGLREWLERTGKTSNTTSWTNVSFADACGLPVNHSMVSTWRTGTAVPRENIALVLATLFGPKPRGEALAQSTLLQEAFTKAVRPAGRPRKVIAAQQTGSGTSPPGKIVALKYATLGPLFKGRKAFLEELRERLLRAHGGIGGAVVPHVVTGMGGVGKTRATIEYGHAYADEYSALAIVDASDPGTLPDQLGKLTGALGLTLPPDAPPEQHMRAAVQWLCANPGWFLILDNVDSDAARRAVEAVLGQLHGGHVVLTSRLGPAAWSGVQTLELDVLMPDDAALFLRDRTEGNRDGRDDDLSASHALALALGNLALALELAGAAITEKNLSFAGYKLLWDQARDKVKGWNEPSITHYHSAVGQTWQTSMAQLSVAAQVLMERLAFLAPDAIPGSLIAMPVPGAKVFDAGDALDELIRFSLARPVAPTRRTAVQNDDDLAALLRPRDVTVHRLIQDATRRGLSPESHLSRLTETLGWLNDAFEGNPQDPFTWPRLDPIAPHAETLVEAADNEGVADPTSGLMNRLGTLAQGKASFVHAEELQRRALAIDEARLAPNHPQLAFQLGNLGANLLVRHQLVEAESLIRRALTIVEENFGPDDPVLAQMVSNLAAVLQQTGKFQEAEHLIRRALAILEATAEPDPVSQAVSLGILADLLAHAKRHEEAETLLRRALSIMEISAGPTHPRVAIRINNLSALLYSNGRYREAETLMRRALTIGEDSLGPDHPEVATRLANLAVLLNKIHRWREAEPLARRALAIDETRFGPAHPNVARDLVSLTESLLKTGHAAEAEPMILRALAIYLDLEHLTGHTHPRREPVIAHLRAVFAALGRDRATTEAALAGARGDAGLP